MKSEAITRRTTITYLVSMAGAPTLGRAVAAVGEPTLYSSHFPNLAAAMHVWQERGGVLVIDADHNEIAPITMYARPGLSYTLRTSGSRQVNYVGRSTYHWFICIYSNGNTPFVIDSDLTIDGQNMVCIPFFVRFENVAGDQRRDFMLSGLTVRNARMRRGINAIDGSRANSYGASGILLSGGFDHLHVSRITVENVTRDANAGLPGFQGCVGIAVTANLNGTQSARHIMIEDFVISRVDSDDLPGSKERIDMDGVLVFQTAEIAGSRPIIQRGVIREAGGRAIKVFAPGGGGVTRDLKIYRSIAGSYYGSADINHQHGDGLIENIDIFYSGEAHLTPTYSISMSTSYSRPRAFPFATGIIRNIKIYDSTRVSKNAIIGLQYNIAKDQDVRRYRIENLIDNGQSRYLFMPGALGTYGNAYVDFINISVDLKVSVFASEDPTQHLHLSSKNLNNRSTKAVVVKTYYDGRRAQPALDVKFDTGSTTSKIVTN